MRRGWIRSAVQKGLRVRNSPTCTLSQNGYGDEVARISGRACANGFAEHSVQLRGWWLDAMIERSAHVPDILALLLPVPQQNSATGTRTRVARVRAEYPNQLDYSGSAVHVLVFFAFAPRCSRIRVAIGISPAPKCQMYGARFTR